MRKLIALVIVVALCGCTGPKEVAREDPAPTSKPHAKAGPTIPLRIENADSRGASIASSGKRVVVVWAATAGDQTNIYAAVSEDDASTFGAPVRVNDVAGDARVNGEQPPRVAVGRDIVVAWQSRRTGVSHVRLARSVDGGKTFQAATTIHETSLTGARGWSSLVLDADGAAHVAWLDGRHATRKPAATKPAAAPGSAHAHASSEPTRQDIFQMIVKPDGTRQEASVATNVCFCCKTSVAAGPGGAVYVAWRHIYPTNMRDMAVAASTDGGQTFRKPVRVHEDGWQIEGCPEDGPSIAVDHAGVLHLAWPTIIDASASRKGIFYTHSADGGRTFAPRLRLDDGAETKHAAHPQLTIAGGQVAVIWEESAATGPRIRTRLSPIAASPTGAAGWRPDFAPAVTLSDPSPVMYPSVAAVTGGIAAAWTTTTVKGSEIHVRAVR